jgi:hypothetical protein
MKTYSVTLASCVCAVLAIGPVFAADSDSGIQKALADLKGQAKTVTNTLKGTSATQEIVKAMEQLRKAPDKAKLASQINVVDAMMEHVNDLMKAVEKARKTNLPALRDRVVQGLRTLSETEGTKAAVLAKQAEAAKGPWSEKYRALSAAAEKLAASYSLAADRHQAAPLADEWAELGHTQEYLIAVKDVLTSLRQALPTIRQDEEALRELTNLSVSIENLHGTMTAFAEEVWKQAIEGGDAGSAPATSGAAESPRT